MRDIGGHREPLINKNAGTSKGSTGMYEQSIIASSMSRKRKNEIIYHSLLDTTLYVN